MGLFQANCHQKYYDIPFGASIFYPAGVYHFILRMKGFRRGGSQQRKMSTFGDSPEQNGFSQEAKPMGGMSQRVCLLPQRGSTKANRELGRGVYTHRSSRTCSLLISADTSTRCVLPPISLSSSFSSEGLWRLMWPLCETPAPQII